jgi:hypothetical protein
MRRWFFAWGGIALIPAACATTQKRAPLDLAPARAALEAAREAGAPERAPEPFKGAQGQLAEAERLLATGQPAAREAAIRAELMAQVALVQATCAQAAQQATEAQVARVARSEEFDRLTTRLRKSDDEQRRLEERIALQQRELEVTETELIRTKARLKGIETRAEASSAIAEARILLRRLDPRTRAPILSRCQDSLTKAEQQLQEENYGAAIFFALKAQDLAVKAQDDTPRRPATTGTDKERPADKRQYKVKVKKANIRKGPGLGEAVVGQAPEGAVLEATVARGEWVKVTHGAVNGWVSLKLLE